MVDDVHLFLHANDGVERFTPCLCGVHGMNFLLLRDTLNGFYAWNGGFGVGMAPDGANTCSRDSVASEWNCDHVMILPFLVVDSSMEANFLNCSGGDSGCLSVLTTQIALIAASQCQARAHLFHDLFLGCTAHHAFDDVLQLIGSQLNYVHTSRQPSLCICDIFLPF